MNELYLFQDGVTYYSFSPTVLDVTFEARTYVATNIKRSNLNLSENFAHTNVKFTFERSHTFAKSIVQNLPETAINVTIYKNGNIFWLGVIAEVNADNSIIEVTCDALGTSINRGGGDGWRLTLHCWKTLYSANCGVLEGDFQSTYTTTASSNVLIVSGITQATGYFNNGNARMDGQLRRILKHEGDTLTLSSPFTGTLTGNIVLSPGCNLTQTNCISFNNLVNHGGCNYIPHKNPFENTGLL